MRKGALVIAFLLVASVTALGQDFAGRFPSGSPHVVATRQFIAQTGVIAPVTIYTPKDTGFYRVSAYMAVTAAGGNGTTANGYFVGYLQSTDESGPQTFIAFIDSPEPDTTANSTSGQTLLVDQGGQPITFSIAAPHDDVAGTQYDVFIVVEELWSDRRQ